MLFKKVMAFLTGMLLVTAGALANPANCDHDMTEDQRWQAGLCSSHLGCRFVMSIADTCVQVKSFLGKLGLGSAGSTSRLSDSAFNEALVDTGVPKTSLADCTTRFDRSLCRQYMGLEQAPIRVAPEPFKPKRRDVLAGMASDLYREYQKGKDGSDYYYAASALEGCAQARNLSDRKNTCDRAQQRVEECNAYRADWDSRKATLLAEADREGLSSVKDLLPRLKMPPCPYELPQTSLTPAKALEQWEAEDKVPVAVATPLTLLRRGNNTGATLFQQSISESEERERQARADAELLALATTNPRAYDNECMARSNRISASTQEARAVSVKNLYQGICSKASQARAQILQADSAIAVAAREREQRQQADAAEAAQRAKEARELASAIGQLLVTAAQLSAASSTPDPVSAPAGGNRQQQAAYQAPQQARQTANAPQGPVHNPANVAIQCITLVQEKNTSMQMKNNCGYYVTISWPKGLHNLRPGGSYPSYLQGSFSFNACRYGGPNGAGMRQYGGTVICHD